MGALGALGQSPPYVLLIPRFTLPYDENPPAQASQRFFVTPVSGDVAGEFLRPERDAGFGRIGVSASAVPVPEAPVNEHRQPVPRENQVGAAGKVFPMQAIAESQTVCNATDDAFGAGVTTLDSGHHLASSLAVDNIRHVLHSIPQQPIHERGDEGRGDFGTGFCYASGIVGAFNDFCISVL